MRLVIGLGNPGPEYVSTRHNLGFRAVERLAERHGIRLAQEKHQSLLGQGLVAGIKVLIAQPQTYMNLSGQAVKRLTSYFDLALADILVLHDDLDIETGAIKVVAHGGAGGHKGVGSIIEHLKNSEFSRIKIGIGRPDPVMTGEDFVLSRFKSEEEQSIENAVDDAVLAAEMILVKGLAEAQERFNRK
ncbi:MAG: aminoacyl-tRNA hydrolase [Deltaproteobacteria bacterium]|nr:aminoacyl-tRNA hydrolase [Deltaproteobacteria bacterium]MBW2140693.1 aminoacyl-tRNA hydrolase [Deltaproteobacteria bacterium]